MLKPIDRFLNSITMYRLMLLGLAVLSVIAVILAFAGVLRYSALGMVLGVFVLLVICQGSNKLLAMVVKAPANRESAYITALILFLIMPPAQTARGILVLVLAGLLAMASKYVLAIRGKHLFNPAAVSALVLALLGIGAASWWVGVGNWIMFGAVTIFGLLMVRKLRKFSMFFAFFITVCLAIVINGAKTGMEPGAVVKNIFLWWPIMFFAAVMFTEPLTTPPSRRLQIVYGVLVGLLFALPYKLGPFYSIPEFALIAGNLFSYLVSPKIRLKLKLKQKLEIGRGIFEFVFLPNRALAFAPGQYLEWTLPHQKPDSRGNRRYFTVASSPTERELHIGVKIPEKASSFKSALKNLKAGDGLVAGQLAGDFVLPKDKTQKIAGVAGGIGITPFRSMVKHMLDKGEKRDFTIFYTCSDPSEFVFKDIFEQAKSLGVKVFYVITEPKNAPANWAGLTGFLSAEKVKAACPDFVERRFFLSGPNVMVDAYKKLLTGMGVSRGNIITDYFPGY
ncbi:MAG: oxidoreductase [Candidatus Doudnabacteria bacterium CG10_big_fil_rev_8_21_14_0_10_42_18]|uniref:Oxidoreductase n=1 Tax=Candidatus Doudnabacteria bacterium CG10_big_fil_rev_8_21_14_0_10_42_18 TaxID=1974552 RepID=A0A2H0VA98_9BACT|nr:MAG: oxidoreductase [Candidatus Doudnabacteria bacterium CG10_big_fil_rev_8_21_14_0_10_42_18]